MRSGGSRPETKSRIAAAANKALQIAITVAVLIPFGTLLESTRFLSRAEQSFINQDVRVCKTCQADIERVIITRDDYDTVFHGVSPLNVGTLSNLIEGINAANPAAVLVDIDTSDSGFAALRQKTPKWPKVIWARRGMTSKATSSSWLGSVLGEQSTFAANEGVASLPEDQDGYIRRYTRFILVAGKDLPSAWWAVLKTGGRADSLKPRGTLFSFATQLPVLVAHSLERSHQRQNTC